MDPKHNTESKTIEPQISNFTHVVDGQGKFDLGKAKRSCKHCYGTGKAGKMHFTQETLVCACVVKKTHELEKMLNK